MSDNQVFDAILDREVRWPRPGDRPFAQSAHRRDSVSIAKHGHTRTVMMMTGYKAAADLMVTHVTRNHIDRDTLVYPIIFNYRQFIELSLKYLIATYGHTVDVNANWTTHNLTDLWKTLLDVLDGYGHEDPDETDPNVAEIIAEFAKVDPDSFSYRYPVDKKGNSIPIAHDELDLRTLADVMDALDSYFTGCDGYLDELQSAGP